MEVSLYEAIYLESGAGDEESKNKITNKENKTQNANAYNPRKIANTCEDNKLPGAAQTEKELKCITIKAGELNDRDSVTVQKSNHGMKSEKTLLAFERFMRGSCLFKCAECNFESTCLKTFWKHALDVHELSPDKYKESYLAKFDKDCQQIECPACSQHVLHEPKSWEKHIMMDHNQTLKDFYHEFYSDVCEEENDGLPGPRTYMAWYGRLGKLKCKLCTKPQEFHKTESSLKEHIKLKHLVLGELSHDNCSSMFTCAVCLQTIIGLRGYVMHHLRSNHNMSLTKYFVEYVRKKEAKTLEPSDNEAERANPQKGCNDKAQDVLESEHLDSPHSNQNELKLQTGKCNYRAKKCNDCKEVFNGQESLRHHITTVHDKLTDRKFPQPNKLENDRLEQDVGSLSTNTDTIQNKTNLHMCKECNKTFARNQNLKLHINVVHLKMKPFKCKKCNKTFSRKIYLQNHVNYVHFNVGPHQCEECNRTFSANFNLENHIKVVHPKMKPHQCSDCDRTFFSLPRLQKHINDVHNQNRPHKCDQCTRAYSCRQNLRRHFVACHLKNKPKKCDKPNKTFRVRRNLQRHHGKSPLENQVSQV